MARMKSLLRTESDWTLTFARLVLTAIFFGHGAQKAFGWFGGPGFDNAINIFQNTMGIPAPLTVSCPSFRNSKTRHAAHPRLA
mgnify:CR=1 FL=1